MGASVYRTRAQGGGLIVLSASVPEGSAYRLMHVTLHLSAAPVTAGNLTVTLNGEGGSNYDTLLKTASMVGVTDWTWQPDTDLILLGGDAVDVAYANPDARVYGVQITLKAV